MLLEQLEYAARVLQGHVLLGKAVLVQLIAPAALVVPFGRLVIAAEHALIEAVILAHDQTGVGVVLDVLVVDLVVEQQVVDHPHEEGDIGAGTDRRVHIRHGGTAVEARINHYHLGAVTYLGLDHPFEPHRVRLGGVAAHDQHHVGVLDIDPVVGHGTATEARCQGRYCRPVTQARLTVHTDDAQRTAEVEVENAGFVGGCRGGQHAGGQPAVDRGALLVLLDEVGVAVVLDQPGDTLDRVFPADALPLVRTGGAVLGVLQAVVTVDIVDQARALGAQRAAADRVIRVTLDMEDTLLGVLRSIAQAVHQHPATHRAIGAVVTGFLGAQQLVLTRLGRLGNARGKAQGGSAGGSDTGST